MEQYVKQIVSYIEYLKGTYHWQITIHDFHYITGRFASYFLPYHVHDNPFCMKLKNTDEVWDTCIYRQPGLAKGLTKPIQFGMCHCGVEEYILPIAYKEENMGFISISGYRQNTELALQKISHVSEKFQLNLPHIKQLYFEHLNPEVPDMELVYTLAAPLVSMLEYLYIRQVDMYNGFDIRNHDESSTFTKALHYLERHYREHITLQGLCAYCNCSCSYMSHIFKQRTGKNMSQYIQELRIAEAKILLSSTSLPITEIALSVGFSSSNYFTNVFRKECHCSPTSYRKAKGGNLCKDGSKKQN